MRRRRGGRSLRTIIASFKAHAAIAVNRARQTPGAAVWQRNYHEHVVRNEADLRRIREYIRDNPRRWVEDPENPANFQMTDRRRGEPSTQTECPLGKNLLALGNRNPDYVDGSPLRSGGDLVVLASPLGYGAAAVSARLRHFHLPNQLAYAGDQDVDVERLVEYAYLVVLVR